MHELVKQWFRLVYHESYVFTLNYKLKKKIVVSSGGHDLWFHCCTGASFAFSIYDFEGKGKVDAYNLGDVLRALNSNPTLATIEKLGGTKKKGEKFLTVSSNLSVDNNYYLNRRNINILKDYRSFKIFIFLLQNNYFKLLKLSYNSLRISYCSQRRQT